MIITQLASVIGSLAPRGLLLSPSLHGVIGANHSTDVYAGITFYANGEEKSTPSSGSYNYFRSRGLWLDRGNPERVWIQWVYASGGTWSYVDSGSTRLQMDVDREWCIIKLRFDSEETIRGRFDFYNAGVDGSLIATTGDISFTASETDF